MTRKQLAERLKRKGVKQPYVVIDEAKKADIRVATALALLENETGIPQRNVFGCDHGEGRAFCHEHVTKERVQKLLASGLANGIGWPQLTYRPYVLEAEKLGGAHKPRFQMRVAFRVLRGNYDRTNSLREMYRLYNGSGPAAEAYALLALQRREKWFAVTNGQ